MSFFDADLTPNENIPHEKRFAGKPLDQLQAIARRTLRRLQEIRDLSHTQVTPSVRSEMTGLLDDLEVLKIEIRDSQPDSQLVPVTFDASFDGKAPRQDPTSRKLEAKPYQLRGERQQKSYRSMFRDDDSAEWRDKRSTFFEALFSGRHHPDLMTRSMNESTPSDGGFLVPVEYAAKIHDVALENELIMPKSLVQPMNSNEIKLPGITIGDHSSNLYGGFSASYKAEASTLIEANPKARQMTLKAKKLTGFVRLSNELVQDAPNGEQQIIDIIGKGLAWYRDKAFLKGSGSGEPLGLLNSNCLIEVAKESGQTAATIIYKNLVDMMARMYAGSFQNSIWIAHQSVIPQLLNLSVAVGTGGSFVPVLQESGDGFKILTRPCIFTEKTEVLGQKGDIILADLSQYIVGLRAGMRIDLSGHVYFESDELACRVIERHDGQPLWNEALTLSDGSTTVSPFVALAERS